MANANPSSPEITGTADIPSETASQGGINESTPAEQRAPKGAKLGKGPKVTESGAYAPASYEIGKGMTRTDR